MNRNGSAAVPNFGRGFSIRDVLPPVRNAYGDLGRSLLDTGHHKVLLNTWTLFQSRRDTKISTPH